MALILLLMIQIFVSISVMAADQQLCPHIFIHNDKFTLNKNEKIIICGDDREAEWKEIPLEQAQVELKGLFQKQGYFNSQFTRKGDDLWIEMGPQTKIDNWILTSNNTVVDSERKRKVRGQPMTPTKLDEIENWIEGELKARGYACPLISSKAQVWDSSVVSHYQTGKKLNITSLQRKGLENLDEEAFRRFDAFEVQDVYNNRKLQLTSNRLLNDGLTQSSYFTQVCTETGVDLIHHLELGEPRILRIGFGASSEELPFLDAWFKNTRIDNRASSYWLLLHASPRIQSLEGSSQLYWIPASKRTYLGPRFKVARNVEDTYENLSGKTGLDIGRLWDAWDNRFDMRAGPTLNYINTIRGFGPDDVSYFTVDGNINVMNNKYELTGAQQFEGTQSSLQYQGQRKGLGSPLNADRWTFRAKNLWNINELAPPYVVLSSRFEGNLTTSDALERTTDREILPTEYRTFLGGEQNLRGFSRQSINNDGLGYLTSAYLGLELRLIEELPWNLEPLILWDGALAGLVPWHLDGPWFESYGLGLRWRSPFGPIRATVAKGLVHNGDITTAATIEQWVFLFSFGREF